MNTFERVSPAMVQSVFKELKENGYSDGQIVALSRELMEIANTSDRRGGATVRRAKNELFPASFWPRSSNEKTGLLGLPEEFESMYLAGLM
jgi:hypothetical protein